MNDASTMQIDYSPDDSLDQLGGLVIRQFFVGLEFVFEEGLQACSGKVLHPKKVLSIELNQMFYLYDVRMV